MRTSLRSPRTPWTPRELKLLQRQYPDRQTKLIAKQLGRSLSSTYQTAYQLGLHKSVAFLALQALERLGCLRLAARIREIREAGYAVKTDLVRRGEKRFARYRMGT